MRRVRFVVGAVAVAASTLVASAARVGAQALGSAQGGS